MGYKFEIGKKYKCIDKRMNPITVIGRTKKTIFIRNEDNEEYGMRVCMDGHDEYVVDDKHTPTTLRGLFCYLAELEI